MNHNLRKIAAVGAFALMLSPGSFARSDVLLGPDRPAQALGNVCALQSGYVQVAQFQPVQQMQMAQVQPVQPEVPQQKDNSAELLGWALLVYGLVPSVLQLRKTLKTQKTGDLSLSSYMLGQTAGFCFLKYRMLQGNLQATIGNVLSFLFNMAVLSVKVRDKSVKPLHKKLVWPAIAAIGIGVLADPLGLLANFSSAVQLGLLSFVGGAICLAAVVSQSAYSWKTKKVEDMDGKALLIGAVGSVGWQVYNSMRGDVPMMVLGGLLLAASLPVYYLKLKEALANRVNASVAA